MSEPVCLSALASDLALRSVLRSVPVSDLALQMAQAKANPLALQKHLDLVPSSAAESVLEPVSDLVLAQAPDYRFHSAPVSALHLARSLAPVSALLLDLRLASPLAPLSVLQSASRLVLPSVLSLALPSALLSVPLLALLLVQPSALLSASRLVPLSVLQSALRSASPLAPLSVLQSASRSASRSASPLAPLSVLPSVSRSASRLVPHSDSETLLFLYLFLLPHPDAPGRYSQARFRSLSDRTPQSRPLSCCRRSSDKKRTHLYCRSSSRHN